MLNKVAPILMKKLSPAEVDSIFRLRESLITAYRMAKPISMIFTTHSIKHSDMILKYINSYLDINHKSLSSFESFALLLSAYLHDIGLVFNEKLTDLKILDIKNTDIKDQHARISGVIIQDRNIQKMLNIDLPDFSKEFAFLLSKICLSHSSTKDYYSLEITDIVDDKEIRVMLLGSLLRLGDSLHTGKSRVHVKNLGLANLSLEQRLFWYRYSRITSVSITPSKIILTIRKPSDSDIKGFDFSIKEPIVAYFTDVLSIINPNFVKNSFPTLTCEVMIVEIDDAESNTTRALFTTPVLEKEIRQRNELRKKTIERRIKKRGLIKNSNIQNELIILKRWSSYTPRMPDWQALLQQGFPNDHDSRGGGYFLVWEKTGIVIDPGYDFLRNFWNPKIHVHKGFELSDINAVIISHAHDDHSNDIEPILSLFHKREKVTKNKTVLPLYISEGTHCKYERLFSISNSAQVFDLIPSKNICSLPIDEKYFSTRGIKLEYIKTDHNELPWMRNHTGVALKLTLGQNPDKIIIGYTSDTKYFDGLADFFFDADILLMHFGNLGPPSNTLDPSLRYDKNHLGLNGCHDLLSNLVKSKIKLFLLDEFGEEEIGGDRIQLCELLSDICSLSSYQKILLPMDINMEIQLPTLKILCQEHDHWIDSKDIVPHLPDGTDGIVYYCQ